MKAPPVPANLLPVQLLKPCPAGQMRKAGPPALPGQTVAGAALRADSEGYAGAGYVEAGVRLCRCRMLW